MKKVCIAVPRPDGVMDAIARWGSPDAIARLIGRVGAGHGERNIFGDGCYVMDAVHLQMGVVVCFGITGCDRHTDQTGR